MSRVVGGLPFLLDEVKRLTRESIFVSMPGEVQSYDPATQRADIKPQLQFTVRDALAGKELKEDLPVIADVPIMFPRFGDFFMTMPVAAGDTVLLVFTDRSIDKWLTFGGNVDPIDLRAHDISDAVAIPGLYPKPDALPATNANRISIGKVGQPAKQAARKGDTVKVTITPDNVVTMSLTSPSGSVTAANSVEVTGEITSGSGNVEVTD